MNPFISICIPTYNQPFYLKRVIDSIFIQTYSNYEIIISDDSDNDDVENLIKGYKLTFPDKRITYIRNSPSLGTPDNWNESMIKASGEWVKIMHHDDCFVDNCSLQKFVDLTSENNDIDFVFSGSYFINSKNQKVENFIDFKTFKKISKRPVQLFCGNLIGSPSVVMIKNRGGKFDKELKWLVDIEFYYNSLTNSRGSNYTDECLIESYAPEQRVTNSCWMNKFVEIPEHLHCINKLNIISLSVLQHTANLFYLLGVYTRKDIVSCGYLGRVPKILLLLIFTKRLINKVKYTFN